jgi:hypothetical protein
MGLQNKKKFLKKHFKCITLPEILPIYVNAISQIDGLFKYLPDTLIQPTLVKLSEIQKLLKKTNTKSDEFDENALTRKIANLSPDEFLKLYVELVEDDESAFDALPEAVCSEASYWLEEIYKSVTGDNGLFSKDFNLEKFIDGFIYNSGGYRVSDLVDLPKDKKPDNADYYFPNGNVIIELKILERDVVESKRDELEQAKSEWQKEVLITGKMILGLDSGDTSGLENRYFNILRKPFEQISAKANKQVRETKKLLDKPDAFGIVLFLNDGSYSLDPFITIRLLSDPIERHFSSIDGFVYFNFRRKAVIQNEADAGHFIWHTRCPSCPDSLVEFADNLGTRWWRFLELGSGNKLGKNVRSYNDDSYLQQLKF